MQTYLNVAQIILGVALVVLVLFEVRSSGMGGVFGGAQTSLIRKRRGPELLLFRLTVGTSVVFFLVAIVNVLIVG
ncbi:MAG: preprotein translocase subunit SecG [Anaerolineae bacterium]|jgi:protein translocase SecG subunit|nr:preprotein translocase subunit SecG [Anaerolineae bacterium]